VTASQSTANCSQLKFILTTQLASLSAAAAAALLPQSALNSIMMSSSRGGVLLAMHGAWQTESFPYVGYRHKQQLQLL
jgi:hypothetical protein